VSFHVGTSWHSAGESCCCCEPGSKSPEEEELLSDALSLLAYADPAASPCGHLLRPGQRLQLAEELNGALLQVKRGALIIPGGNLYPVLRCGASGPFVAGCSYRYLLIVLQARGTSAQPLLEAFYRQAVVLLAATFINHLATTCDWPVAANNSKTVPLPLACFRSTTVHQSLLD
jgi:hypothetical protein